MHGRCLAVSLFLAFISYATSDPVTTSTQSNAVIIDLTKTSKTCPTGFEDVQGVCTRTIYTNPEIVCITGTYNNSTKTCISYVARTVECMPGFTMVDSLCVLNRTTLKTLQCPEDYLLDSNGETCVKHTELPSREMCPAGSTAKGDICVVITTTPPTLVCPTGFTLSNNKCYIEETYDCTPIVNTTTTTRLVTPTIRPTIRPTKSPPIIVIPTARPPIHVTTTTTRSTGGGSKADALFPNSTETTISNIRLARLSAELSNRPPATITSKDNITVGVSPQPANIYLTQQGGVSSYFSPWTVFRSSPSVMGSASTFFRRLQSANSKVSHIITHDYVSSSICKRRRVVAAHMVCSSGYLNNTVCVTLIQVEAILVPGGVHETVVTPTEVCPDGYIPVSTNSSLCLVQEIMAPTYLCPTGSTAVGLNCTVSRPPLIHCPANYTLTNNLCVQTQTTIHKVEYTVTYSCKGKTCGPP